MLSQYTWGQFFEFVAIALVLYYLVIGFVYYRNDLGSLLKRKGDGQLSGAATGGGTAAPASLVRTTSAFAPIAAPAVGDTQTTTAPPAPPVLQDEEGAAKNLAAPAAAIVGGSLPNSTAAATGSDKNVDDAAPMDSAVVGDEAALADEQRAIELDEADAELVKLLHQASVTMPIDEPSAESVSEISANDDFVSQNVATLANAESDTAYQALDYPEADPLYLFDESIASPLDALPVGVNQFIPATDILAYIQQVQAGAVPTASANLLATTSLPDRMKELQQQFTGELDALFD